MDAKVFRARPIVTTTADAPPAIATLVVVVGIFVGLMQALVTIVYPPAFLIRPRGLFGAR